MISFMPTWSGLAWSAGIVAALTVTLVVIEIIVRRAAWPSDLTRRIAHVLAVLAGIGVYFTAGALTTVALGIVFVIALTISQRRALLTSVHGVARDSHGEVLLPLAIGLAALTALSPEVFIATMLVTGLADVAAGLVGDLRRASDKTWWGSAAFAAVTLAVALVVMPHPLWTPLLVVLTTLVERLSRAGLDNLTVPLAALVVLNAQASGLWAL